MRTAFTTSEVATLYRIPAGSVARHMARRDVAPLGRVRVGRSWVTRWAYADVMAACPVPI